MKQLTQQFSALVILGCVSVVASGIISKFFERKSDIEDAEQTVIQLLAQHGYRGEFHTVNTEDGYILELQRITGPESDPSPDGKQPVLIVHGLLCSSIDFMITGPGRALGYVLADEGYDVWLGNVRGNVFSRRHQNYTTLNKEYWQFSWHEMGVQDVPAMVDYILEKTNKTQLLYVGHSQGTTAFWVMTSERPEYQDKVKAMVALAPSAYKSNTRNPVFSAFAKNMNNIDRLSNIFGRYEFKPAGNIFTKLKTMFCDEKSWTQPICTNAMFFFFGPVSNQLNATMLPAIVAHVPAGASIKQLIHYGQVVESQKFQQYDYGPSGNLLKYNQSHPPAYDLSKIKVPVYLHYSSNDWLTVPSDVNRLYEELGNPIGMFRVPLEEFTHLDFLWANDIKDLVYNKVIDQLRLYDD